MIVRGLATGEPIDAADILDHPLAEELHGLHTLLLEIYPFQQYRHLYHAAESMYLAQHRDAARTAGQASSIELTAMYPDIFIKASMSRVVANVLAPEAWTTASTRVASTPSFSVSCAMT